MATLTVRRYAAVEGGTETEMHVHTETLTGLTAAQARRERVEKLRADGVEHEEGSDGTVTLRRVYYKEYPRLHTVHIREVCTWTD